MLSREQEWRKREDEEEEEDSWLESSSEEQTEFERLCTSVRVSLGDEFEREFRQKFHSVLECLSVTKAEFISRFHTEEFKRWAGWYFECTLAMNLSDYEAEDNTYPVRRLEPVIDGVLSLDQFVSPKRRERNPRLWSWKMVHGLKGDFSNVKKITFKGCSFSRIDFKDVFKFVTSGKFPNLETVDLSGNCLNCPKELGKLIGALQKKGIGLVGDPI